MQAVGLTIGSTEGVPVGIDSVASALCTCEDLEAVYLGSGEILSIDHFIVFSWYGHALIVASTFANQ